MERDDVIKTLKYFKNRYITEYEYGEIGDDECHYKVECINELLEEFNE